VPPSLGCSCCASWSAVWPTTATHDHGVAVSDEAEHGLELRPVVVRARDGVGERPLDGDAVQLPVDPLVEAAHPLIGDSLPSDHVPDPEVSG